VHWHRKPARPFREVTSHDLRMAVLEEALPGRASLFSLAVLDCSGFAIRYPFLAGWLLFLLEYGRAKNQAAREAVTWAIAKRAFIASAADNRSTCFSLGFSFLAGLSQSLFETLRRQSLSESHGEKVPLCGSLAFSCHSQPNRA
jgi:hypothetical protein